MKKASVMILATMMTATLCAGCGNSNQGAAQTQAATTAAAAPESTAEKADNAESS